MKIKIILSILFLCLASCGGGSSSSNKGSKPTNPAERPTTDNPPVPESNPENEGLLDSSALIGKWEREYKGCPEYIEFTHDASILIEDPSHSTELQNYTASEVSGLPKLYEIHTTGFTTISEGTYIDCDYIGEDDDAFIESPTHYRVYEDRLVGYLKPNFSTPSAEYYRISDQSGAEPSAPTSSTTNYFNDFNSQVKNIIWSNYYADSDCTDSITFMEPNVFVGTTIISGEPYKEWKGTFSVVENTNFNDEATIFYKRYLINLTITEDNELIDCNGTNYDNKGTDSFSLIVSPNMLKFYDSIEKTEPYFFYYYNRPLTEDE